MNPAPASLAVPRFLPDEPFPPYTYVPSQSAHPTADPAGHSFGHAPPQPDPVDPEQWSSCRPYLYGIDLFNAGFYWESHVEWEGLWLACGRQGVLADFLKGLIKLAAAGVKYREGKPKGVRSHSRRAAELWRAVASSRRDDDLLGLRVSRLIDLADAIHRDGWPDARPQLDPCADVQG